MERIDKATLQIVVKSQADRRALNSVEESINKTSSSVTKLQKELDKLSKKEPKNKKSKKYAEWKNQNDGVTEEYADFIDGSVTTASCQFFAMSPWMSSVLFLSEKSSIFSIEIS